MSSDNFQDFGFHEVRFSGPLLEERDLRNWWHEILRHHGQYRGYLFFLTLPNDEDANKYLKDFGKELHLISGKNILVVILTDIAIMRHDYDKDLMPIAVNNQIQQGYSLRLAELFGVRTAEFPCILFFENIHTSEHVLFSLKQLSTLEIASKVRNIVDIVNVAVKKKASVIVALKQFIRKANQSKIQDNVMGTLRSLPAKTLGAAIETWLKTLIQ